MDCGNDLDLPNICIEDFDEKVDHKVILNQSGRGFVRSNVRD